MKIVRNIALLLLVLQVFACTQKTPVLRVGMKPDFPPFEFRENTVLAGFDVDLARELGNRMGYKITFVEMEFDELLPGLREDKIDLAISAITINSQRSELVEFSLPYFSADQVILARLDCDINITSEANLSTFKIGTQNGTTGQYYLQYNLVDTGKLPWDQLIAFDNNDLAISALLNEEIDLLIMDNTAASAFCCIKPFKICYVIPTDEEYGIAFKKGSTLKTSINTALSEIMKSRLWNQMITAYMCK